MGRQSRLRRLVYTMKNNVILSSSPAPATKRSGKVNPPGLAAKLPNMQKPKAV